MVTAVLDWAVPCGIGFSHVVSLGDMADVDFGDMLDYLARDDDTRAILLYIEGITNARKFMSAARVAARNKPVLVVKVGRHAESARAAASHTGALAGSDAVYDAAFRRAGLLRVLDTEQLFDGVETLALTGPQQGDRLAILTNGGGPGVLATDALIDVGGRLAELSPSSIARLNAALPKTWSHANPVDIIGDAPGHRYATALETLIDDEGIDAILILNCPTAVGNPTEAAQAVIETIGRTQKERLSGRNIFTSWLGRQSAEPARRLFGAARLPTYDTPDQAVGGFIDRVRFRKNQELLLETPASRPDNYAFDVRTGESVIRQALAAGRSWLDSEDVDALFAAYGVPMPGLRTAADPGTAAAVAEELGYPVALKIRSPDITHKTDVGGVALNLGSKERVREEASTMLERVRAARPDAMLSGFTIQQMVHRPQAVELIVGVVDDATFGPVVLFGHGGIAVEALNDSTLELPPLNEALARAQMARTRVWKLLQGIRGQRPADIHAVADTLVRISQMVSDHAEICELDINPLLADADGVLAVDGRVRVRPATIRPAMRLAISPYPRDLEREDILPDGTLIQIRPIRAEDEPSLKDLVANMTVEQQRSRFGRPTPFLDHVVAARLSHLDYDREMALLAFSGETCIGVARYEADPDNAKAQFVLSFRNGWQGRGLEDVLMYRLLAAARHRGLRELASEIPRSNEALLRSALSLGFQSTEDPGNPAIVRLVVRMAAQEPEPQEPDGPTRVAAN